MHHPAAQHFQPFTVFTHDVHFCRRFGKREVGRTEADFEVLAETKVDEAGAARLAKSAEKTELEQLYKGKAFTYKFL